MSTDDLLRLLEQNARTISSLRQHAPLFAVIAVLEDRGAPDLDEAILHLLRQSEFPGAFVEFPEVTYFGGAFTQGHAVYVRPGVSQPEAIAAYRAYQVLAERMRAALFGMPDDVASRLGFQQALGPSDWLTCLFGLAWHFPSYFAGGAVHRFRLLRADLKNMPADFRGPEDWLQLHPCNLSEDRFPGIIYSQFPAQLDLVTATECAIDLLLRAVRKNGSLTTTPDRQTQFRELHRVFTLVGQQASNLAPDTPFTEFDAKVLRLDSSFETQPASVWAGIEVGVRGKRSSFRGRMP